jgi:hypothetical protein
VTITVASFRVDFPEFGSTTNYPSSGISYYLALSGLLLNKRRFGQPGATVTNPPNNMYDMAQELFVAHHVVLEATAQRAAAVGGVPGSVTGPISGKTTGPISVSYDPGSVVSTDAGFWNQTVYGLRFWRMMQMFGAGPVQLGVGGGYCGPCFNGVPLNGPAWPGPIFQGVGPVN